MTDDPLAVGTAPSVLRMLWRGVTKRCPACGQNKLFRRWFTMVDLCPRCGLLFERIEGHWLGSIGVNIVVSLGALLAFLVAGLILTFPDFPIMTLTIINAAVAIVVPLAFHPVSRTLWTAIDVAMRPLEPFEVDWTKLP